MRTNPPSLEANNTDVFIWALYLLGGAAKQIDVEEIYLKAFELAPARMGWRTRPDLPNFKKTAKALQEIEAKSHVGLLQKLGANYRRLTPAGVSWVEQYKSILSATYSNAEKVAAPKNTDIFRRERELKSSQVWDFWQSGNALTLELLAFALQCSKSSSQAIWQDRLADLDFVASNSADQQIKRFAEAARETYKKESRNG